MIFAFFRFQNVLELVPIFHSNRATVNLFISRANSLDHPSPSWISCISLPVEKMNWRRMHSAFWLFPCFRDQIIPYASWIFEAGIHLGAEIWNLLWWKLLEMSCWPHPQHQHPGSSQPCEIPGFYKEQTWFHRISPTVQCLRGSRKALHVYPPAMHFGVSTILYFKAWKQTG